MGEWDWYSYFLFGGALAFAFVFLYQYDMLKGKDEFLYLLIGLLPCLCLYAFRSPDVGLDLVRYVRHIDVAKFGAKFYFFYATGGLVLEPLSRLVMFISYHLGGIQPFIILSSVIQYIFVFIFLRKLHLKGYNVAIIFLIYFSVIMLRSTSMVRNGLAISASFCAYSYLLDKDPKRGGFWLYSLLALGFHNSAILNIPVYFICCPIRGGYWDKFGNIVFKLISIISVFLLFFALKTGLLGGLISSVADGRYAHYEMSDSWGVGNILTRLPLLLIFVFYLKDLMKMYGQNVISLLYLMIFDLVVSQARYVYSDIERFTQYTAFGEIIFITLFYEFIRRKNTNFPYQFLIYPIVVSYFTYYIYRWAILSNYGIMPYRFMDW